MRGEEMGAGNEIGVGARNPYVVAHIYGPLLVEERLGEVLTVGSDR